MDNIQQIIKNMRTLRERKGYSQEYLAVKLKISQNAYSKIEIGQSRMTLDRLLLIADILEIDVLILMNSNESHLAWPLIKS